MARGISTIGIAVYKQLSLDDKSQFRPVGDGI